MSKNCDRCGEYVPEEDNILDVEALMADGFTYGFAPRHIACSPSRAQYICVEPYGQPDERPEYDKRIHVANGLAKEVEEHEKEWTDAFLKHRNNLQKRSGQPPWYRLCPSFMGGLPQTDCGHPECHERQKEN